MDWLREIISRCVALFGRKKLDGDLEDELQGHIELAIHENLRKGMNPQQARTEAMRSFGGVTQIREAYRVQRSVPFFEVLGKDVRYALRRLRSSPGFTSVAVITLALGIGANTAVFTLVQGILLRSLPVSDPSSLYRIGDKMDCCYYSSFENDDGDFDLFSYDLYLQFKQSAPEFEQLAAVESGGGGYSVRRGNAPAKPLRSEYVSGNYFTTLGIAAHRGRPFTQADDGPGAAPVLVLSYQAWQTEFAADPDIVGSTVYVQKLPFIVVGVAPPGFFGDRIVSIPPDFWLPLSAEPVLEGEHNSALRQKGTAWLYALGRLRQGTNLAVLDTKLSSVLQQWMYTRPEFTQSGKASIVSRQYVRLSPAGGGIRKLQSQAGTSLRMLMILSSVVLLIACANIANLLLARGTARRAEIAVRMALGAARTRLIRQILTESFLLSLMGGIAGLALAYLGCRMILALAFPEAHNMPVQASPSLAVLGFAFAVSLLTGVVFGTVPAWVSSHAEPAEAFRGTGRSTRDQSSFSQRALIVFQLALSIVLLAGTFLVTRSLIRLEHQDFGITTTNRYTFRTDLQNAGYTTEQLPALYKQIESRLTSLPGVTNMSFSMYLPLGGNQWGTCIILQGHPAPGPNDKCFTDWDRVSTKFLGSVGVPILRGRDFNDTDTPTSPQVVLVNQAFANQFFPGVDPIGKHFGPEYPQYSGAFEIVGVFADFKLSDARKEPRPLYLRLINQRYPYHSANMDGGEEHSLFLESLIVNFSSPQQGAETLVKRTFAQINPNLSVSRFMPYDALVADNFNQERLLARLTSAFGLIALLLASVGLYGTMSYAVARRTSEIGIRMAIGASRSTIIRMVLRGAFTELLLGLLLGIPASLYAGHLMTTLLYHVSGFDPVSLGGAAAVLIVCAAIAALVPAQRASSIDPMAALRTE